MRKELAIDIPTIGYIYPHDNVMRYFNGLGRKVKEGRALLDAARRLDCDAPGMLPESEDRSWHGPFHSFTMREAEDDPTHLRQAYFRVLDRHPPSLLFLAHILRVIGIVRT